MKKRRRSFFDEIFGEDIFKDFLEFPEISHEGFGSSYSIQVSQIGDKTVVRAKVSGDVEVEKFRKELEERYPGAEIIIEGGRPLIEEIGGKKDDSHTSPKRTDEATVSRKKQKNILIEEIREEDE